MLSLIWIGHRDGKFFVKDAYRFWTRTIQVVVLTVLGFMIPIFSSINAINILKLNWNERIERILDSQLEASQESWCLNWSLPHYTWLRLERSRACGFGSKILLFSFYSSSLWWSAHTAPWSIWSTSWSLPELFVINLFSFVIWVVYLAMRTIWCALKW